MVDRARKMLTTYVDPATDEWVRARAEREHRSVSQTVWRLIADAARAEGIQVAEVGDGDEG